jgi:hypothetical protein
MRDAGTSCYSSHLPRNGLDKYGSSANTFPGLLTSVLTPVQEDLNAGEEGVTCLNVLATLHAALQCPLTDTEWGTAGDDKRASLIRARDRRSMMQPALQRSSDSVGCAASMVRYVPGDHG